MPLPLHLLGGPGQKSCRRHRRGRGGRRFVEGRADSGAGRSGPSSGDWCPSAKPTSQTTPTRVLTEGDSTTPSPVIVGPSNALNAPVGVAATPPLSIVTTSLRTAHAGRRYLVNIVAAEGTTRTGGRSCHRRLPRGLRRRKTGAIIGTPHARARVYRFTVRVRDRTHPAQVVTQRLRLRLKGRGRLRRHHRRHHIQRR